MVMDDWIGELEKVPQRWERVNEELADFQSYLAHAPKVPKLSVEEGCSIESCRPESKLEGHGVYLLFGSGDELLYVGLTEKTVHERLSRHLRKFEAQRADVIILSKELAWLAFSLERFLIQRLSPPMNVVGTTSKSL